MKLEGNKILITGGSAGIGLALAKKFVALGNEVIVTGRSQSKLDEAKQSCPDLITHVCDVADVNMVKKFASELSPEHPDLNVLINNAGTFIARNMTAATSDLEELTREVDINIKGTIYTTASFVSLLTKNKGSIINVSSGLAFVPLMAAPVYCATKAFIHSYTTSMRYQLQDLGVDVIELAPPAVKTALTADMPEDGDFKMLTTDELVKATIAGIRAGKKLICPGQAKQLRFMSRLAPSFIEDQLAKGSKSFLPPAS